MQYRALWLERQGNHPDQWEDAFSVDADRGRFAIADGATESAYAKSWAQCLVDDFVTRSTENPRDWIETVPQLQAAWAARFRGVSLPWYAEAKLRHGAFSTLLGLTLTPGDASTAHWQAIAIGDSCLFQCREGTLRSVFPLESAKQFHNHPHLLGSRTTINEIRTHRLCVAHGQINADDRLWLMSDALAQWCLTEHEASRNPWPLLESLLPLESATERFANWINELRDLQQIRNDDVTLLGIWL